MRSNQATFVHFDCGKMEGAARTKDTKDTKETKILIG
jgi:hypothetical protein